MFKIKKIFLILPFIISSLSSCNLNDDVKEFYKDNNLEKTIIYCKDSNNETQLGIIDYKGNVVVDVDSYHSLFIGEDNKITVNKNDSSYILDNNQKIETTYKFLSPYFGNCFIAQDPTDLYGIIDDSLNYIVQPVFESIEFYCYGTYVAKIGEVQYIGYNSNYKQFNGNIVKGTSIGNNNYFISREDNFYYLLDKHGNNISENYTNISFIRDVAICRNDNGITLINLNDKTTLSFANTSEVMVYNSSFFVIKNENNISLYSYVNGNIYDFSLIGFDLFDICENLLILYNKQDRRYMFINKNGETYSTNIDEKPRQLSYSPSGNHISFTYDNEHYILLNNNFKPLLQRYLKNNIISTFYVGIEGVIQFTTKKGDEYIRGFMNYNGKILYKNENLISSLPCQLGRIYIENNLYKYQSYNGKYVLESENKLSYLQNSYILESGENFYKLYNLYGEMIYESINFIMFFNISFNYTAVY